MSSEWSDCTLGDFVRLQRGHDLTALEQKPGLVPVMGSAGPNGTHSESKATGPGVVIGRSGASMGKVHRSEVDYWPHNTCIYVTDFLGNNPHFAYYLLGTLDLAAFNSGSAQPSLNRNFIYSMPLRVPGRDEQDRLVEMLRALDDRIFLLRETNATLEAIAQALFKSWFVDFDPVRAKLEGRAPEGMDEATAALFPDGFEESELGLVPRGWRVGQLGDELKIAYGKNLPTNKLLSSGYPVYGGNGQIGFFDKYLYEGRQVLVACRGAASGKFNQSVPRAFVTNNSLILESGHDTLLPFGYLKGCIARADLIPFVTGSAQPQVTIDNLKNFKLLVPSAQPLQAFESYSSSIEDQIENNNQQSTSPNPSHPPRHPAPAPDLGAAAIAGNFIG